MTPPKVVVPRLAWAGRLTLLAAREKAGKSTFASAGAAALTVAQPFLDGPPADGDVLWCAQEHAGDFARRIQRQGCRTSRVTVLDLIEAGAHALDMTCTEIMRRRPALCVVDSLSDVALGRVRDSNSPTEWKPLMQALAKAARATDCAVILIHHANKANGTYRDSTEIGAFVDVIIELEPLDRDREDTGLRKFRPKGRIPDLSPFDVQFDGTGFRLAHGTTPLTLRVLTYVSSHPGCSQKSVQTAVGARLGDVRQAIEDLIKQRLISDIGNSNGRRFHPTQSPLGENSGNRPGIGWEQGREQVTDLFPSGSTPIPSGLTPNSPAPFLQKGGREPDAGDSLFQPGSAAEHDFVERLERAAAAAPATTPPSAFEAVFDD